MRIVATYTQRKQIDEILSMRLHPVEDTNLFRYEDGWDDARVAHEVSPQLTANTTAHVRSAVYGKLQKIKTIRVSTSARDRLERLETRFERFLDCMVAYGGVTQAERDTINEDKPK